MASFSEAEGVSSQAKFFVQWSREKSLVRYRDPGSAKWKGTPHGNYPSGDRWRDLLPRHCTLLIVGVFFGGNGISRPIFPGVTAAILWLSGVSDEAGEVIIGGEVVLTLFGLGLLAEGFRSSVVWWAERPPGSRWRGAVRA